MTKPKTISNVLLCSKENTLRLADIIFDEKIIDIKYKASGETKWEDISTKETWQKFISNQKSKSTEKNNSTIDGEYMLLMPGAIDPHVHFNTPGFEDREDFEHGSAAAAIGGVTTIVDMPCTSIPPVTNANNFNAKADAITGRSFVDYAFWGGVAGNDFENNVDIQKQIIELAEQGVAGFKAYLLSGMDSFADLTEEQMIQAAKWIKETNLPLAVHAEDKSLVSERIEHLKNIGNKDWQAYYFSRDEQAESLAVMKMINIAKQTGCRIHIVHLSSQFGVELIRQAKNEGLNVTAETCPHYLFFTKEDFNNHEISTFLKTAPPVKTEYDRLSLWEALKDGTLEFLTTDHAGCDPEKEKKGNDFWKIYGGIPGVEHRAPFFFSEGLKRGRLTLEKIINLLSTNASNYFGFTSKGKLLKGYDADFALINLWKSKSIKASDMHSKGKYTPFEGKTFEAVVDKTILRGRTIIDNGHLINNNKFGNFIKNKSLEM